MKNILLIAIGCTFSLSALSFQDFVQDLNKNDLIVHTSIGSSQTDTELSIPGASSKESSDTDSISFSAATTFEVDSDSLFLMGAGIDKSTSEGEDSTSTDFSAQYILKQTDDRQAIGFGFSYEAADEGDRDSISFSISKQLTSSSNEQLDGELLLDLTLPENTDTLTGGNLLMLGMAGRLKLNHSVRLFAGGVLSVMSDLKADNGVTWSSDPSFAFVVGAGYQLMPQLSLDLSYSTVNRSGAASNGSSKVNIDSSSGLLSIGLQLTL